MEFPLSENKIISILEYLNIYRMNNPQTENLINSIEEGLYANSTILFPGPLDELNFEIMYMLDDESLYKACQVNRKTANLCSNQQFWRNKVIRKFGIDIKGYVPKEESYKSVYRKLSTSKGSTKYYLAISMGLYPLVLIWTINIQQRKYQIKPQGLAIIHGQQTSNIPFTNIEHLIAILDSIDNNYLKTVEVVLRNMSIRQLTFVLDRVHYCKIIKAANLDMFEMLLDHLKITNKRPKINCYKFLYIYADADYPTIHRILEKSYNYQLLSKDVLIELLTEVRDYSFLEQLSLTYNW